ncbi:MAG: osmoprotectant transport system substrate-binding protein [Actinomycetota bacterium]|jgi:hypothetical protein|nr:osmoprotectant transport system substrate-binding protein [Actinomycetota bacterium]
MGSQSSIAWRTAAFATLLSAGCSSGPAAPPVARWADDHTVTVASFDFAESRLLAELYNQAIEAGGYDVRRAFDLGPRELVAPGLALGLVDRRFERPEQLPPNLRSTRFYLFAGGWVTYHFAFEGGATAAMMFDVDRALGAQPRAELVAEVRDRNGLRLCGAGAGCPGGS